MSTEIFSGKGKKEVPNTSTRTSDYKDQEIVLTRFYGGNERGMSLQISIGDDSVQLDNKTANELVTALIKAFC